ncbi:MAG: 50S ribosomal protein L24 [Desulfobulbaceae bacterium]|uniref:Large ribosomal subunit protein uL24 n=1 Tax=Candidatus Desulfobia pelagia TaxID=2841692 RepID=A0A8J6TCX6_9BACT|nr:50S ribosomal protein L24 [Candidatus Desulfobia pelagia]
MKAGTTHIKLNDKVEVIAGKDKGRVGKVITVYPKLNKAKVEKINMVKRHTKPSAHNQQGGIIEMEAPIDVSNLMLICSKCTKTVRIKKEILEDGTKVRVCKKCNETIETSA